MNFVLRHAGMGDPASAFVVLGAHVARPKTRPTARQLWLESLCVASASAHSLRPRWQYKNAPTRLSPRPHGYRSNEGTYVIYHTVEGCAASFLTPALHSRALMASALLLEALQALTPDRWCDLRAALYGVAVALAAALVADLSMQPNGRTRVALQAIAIRLTPRNQAPSLG
jgi:hypothetical protein